ncbi:DUF4835 domain-containing protein [Riemerella anatipestifer]|uniref:DUF4835 family protein n=1 Tax=Riemerella anatipestifer TaxID=34085 RepID=A0AAP6HEV9_RIEAN|nr:DUF4835 family protein [Riemerella anatipestifer]MBT0549394.1 DUF4835 family protein [Riemerella anatipestifer]MBT0555955.1 DUF4835 family protein [Riemerella anatipestifer]MBT0560157.1 DUF4835 family protein [Riemerella anatipestifer]MCD5968666.1 DUF4835 family protein [Riemerella anatipestifer]MCO4304603.1 DUF4835 family protein [Riemerella anatipestifer]
MKKIIAFFGILFGALAFGQELHANVQINFAQVGGSNTQVFKTLEKNLREFINNTSWTGKKLQNFEKIKCNFAIIISERTGNNSFRGSLVVQSTRPVFNTQYESPLLNINDTNFSFEYAENENLIFNERQFSGKNLIDVVSFYVYLILGYDADSFQNKGGEPWFEKSQKIAQNSQNQNYKGWSQMEGQRTRGALIDNILKSDFSAFRQAFYQYHRQGLDNMYNLNANSNSKKAVADALLNLRTYENGFQMNYPFNIFIDTKKDEIYNIFNSGNNASVNMTELKSLMSVFAPKDIDGKWDKWK